MLIRVNGSKLFDRASLKKNFMIKEKLNVVGFSKISYTLKNESAG